MRSCETSSSYVYLFLGKSVSCLSAKVWCVCALLAFSFLLTWFLLLSLFVDGTVVVAL